MRLEFINGLQYDDIWMVNELDHFIIQCIPNGNPKPKVQISVSTKISFKYFYNSHCQSSILNTYSTNFDVKQNNLTCN